MGNIYTKNGPTVSLLDASQMNLNIKRSTGNLNLPAETKSLNSNTHTQLNEPKKEEEIVEKEK